MILLRFFKSRPNLLFLVPRNTIPGFALQTSSLVISRRVHLQRASTAVGVLVESFCLLLCHIKISIDFLSVFCLFSCSYRASDNRLVFTETCVEPIPQRRQFRFGSILRLKRVAFAYCTLSCSIAARSTNLNLTYILLPLNCVQQPTKATSLKFLPQITSV